MILVSEPEAKEKQMIPMSYKNMQNTRSGIETIEISP